MRLSGVSSVVGYRGIGGAALRLGALGGCSSKFDSMTEQQLLSERQTALMRQDHATADCIQSAINNLAKKKQGPANYTLTRTADFTCNDKVAVRQMVMESYPNYPRSTGKRPSDSVLLKDPYGYLRTCVTNADWDGVARFYATEYTKILQKTANASAFYKLATLNVQDYTSRTLTVHDLAAFTRTCILKYCVYDMGKYAAIGYKWGGVANSTTEQKLIRFFKGLKGLNWFKSYCEALNGRKYGFCVGWVQEPSLWTPTQILKTAIMIAGAAIVAAAVLPAAVGAGGAGAGGAAGASGTAAATGTAGTAGAAGTAGGITAATTGGVTEIVVTAAAAPVISAGAAAATTVGAGLAAGSVIASSTPPPMQPPPAVNAPVEEIIVTDTALPSAGAVVPESVASALTTGSVVATSTPPAPVESAPTEITVEGERIEQVPVSAAETAATGLTSVGISYDAIQIPELNVPQYDVQQGLLDTVKGGLTDAAGALGSNWVQSELEQYLRDLLGRDPTQQELDEWGQWVEDGLPEGQSPADRIVPTWAKGVLGVALAFAALAVIMDDKKGGKKGRKRRQRPRPSKSMRGLRR